MFLKYWKQILVGIIFIMIVVTGVYFKRNPLLCCDPFEPNPSNKEIILIYDKTLSNDSIKIVHNTILGVDDTIKEEKVSIQSYHNNLTDILKVLVATDGNQYANRENVKWQFRLFYAAIISGVALLLFSRQKLRHSSYLITIAIICGMFVVELHLYDLSNQYFFVYTKEVNSLDFLSSLDSHDSTRYVLRREILSYELDKPTFGERISRKYLKFFNPDIEQIILFTLPLFVFLILYMSRFNQINIKNTSYKNRIFSKKRGTYIK